MGDAADWVRGDWVSSLQHCRSGCTAGRADECRHDLPRLVANTHGATSASGGWISSLNLADHSRSHHTHSGKKKKIHNRRVPKSSGYETGSTFKFTLKQRPKLSPIKTAHARFLISRSLRPRPHAVGRRQPQRFSKMGDRTFSEIWQPQKRSIGSLANFPNGFPTRGCYCVSDPRRKSHFVERSVVGKLWDGIEHRPCSRLSCHTLCPQAFTVSM